MSKLWKWTLAVGLIAVGLLWVLPISAHLAGTDEVVACESLVTTGPGGVDALIGFGQSDTVANNVLGGEDDEDLPLWAALGTQRACDVERQNRQTHLFLALGVGATALILLRRPRAVAAESRP